MLRRQLAYYRPWVAAAQERGVWERTVLDFPHKGGDVQPGDKGSEGGRYPNKCCASRDLGSQEIPHPGRHPEKPQKPIGCLKWSSDVQDRLQERYLTVEGGRMVFWICSDTATAFCSPYGCSGRSHSAWQCLSCDCLRWLGDWMADTSQERGWGVGILCCVFVLAETTSRKKERILKLASESSPFPCSSVRTKSL